MPGSGFDAKPATIGDKRSYVPCWASSICWQVRINAVRFEARPVFRGVLFSAAVPFLPVSFNGFSRSPAAHPDRYI